MFREMRLKNRQFSGTECEQVLAAATSGVLALSGDDGYPYAVPMSYVYDNGKIYFHCAKQGHKIDAISRNDKASFCVVTREKVLPLEYSVDYVSVIAFGRVRILSGDEALSAIVKLAKRYTPDNDEGLNAEMKRYEGKYYMLELNIEHLTGKRSKKS